MVWSCLKTWTSSRNKLLDRLTEHLGRDSYYLGLQNKFDHDRYINFARVCEVDGKSQICARDKEVDNLYDMFHTRFCLHRRAYQHRVVNLIEFMIADAFVKANEHIKIEGSGGRMFRMSDTIDDMEAYTKLTDQVFEQILHSSSPELAEAREILENIIRRRLYKFVADTRMEVSQVLFEDWARDVARRMNLDANDFVRSVIRIDYGMKEDDPIDQMRFYKKDDPTKAFKISKDQVLFLKPKIFSQHQIRIYYKKQTDKKTLDAIKDDWRSNFPKPQDPLLNPRRNPRMSEDQNRRSGGYSRKRVQQIVNLTLNLELIYPNMGNSDFSVPTRSTSTLHENY